MTQPSEGCSSTLAVLPVILRVPRLPPRCPGQPRPRAHPPFSCCPSCAAHSLATTWRARPSSPHTRLSHTPSCTLPATSASKWSLPRQIPTRHEDAARQPQVTIRQAPHPNRAQFYLSPPSSPPSTPHHPIAHRRLHASRRSIYAQRPGPMERRAYPSSAPTCSPTHIAHRKTLPAAPGPPPCTAGSARCAAPSSATRASASRAAAR